MKQDTPNDEAGARAKAAPAPSADDSRWAAVKARDRSFDGAFYYSVATTGVYCRRALEGMASVKHLLPEALESTSASDFDLFLAIDDGLPYDVPDRLRPSAWWAIDTHLDFDRCLRRAQGADLVFAAQRSGAERLRRAGIDSAMWLPLACDPAVHRPHLAAESRLP